MNESICNGYINSKELPDLIVTLDKGIIFHTLYVKKTIFNNWVKENGEKYIHLRTTKEKTLGLFLLILLCFETPEPLISDFIIKEYLK